MSQLIVLTFNDQEKAGEIREALTRGQHGGYVSLDDSAVVVKDEEGKVHVKNEVDRGIKVGAVGGGFLGFFIAAFFFPIAGILLGIFGGALVGKFFNMGVEQKFIKEVSEALKPGMSALFILIREGEPAYVLRLLEQYEGTVYQTTLPSEVEDELRKEMSKHKNQESPS